MSAPWPTLQNRLLAKFPEAEMAALRPHLEPVMLSRGQCIIAPHEPIAHAYFPTGALLSLITIMEDGSTVESGTVGLEGMAGVPILLAEGTTSMETVAQVPGAALRVRAEVLKEAFDRGGDLQAFLYRYLHTLFVVASQAAACNRLHHLEARFCRWLLMSSDGVASPEISITQEYLAAMLGVRRAGVTAAALKVQSAGLIKYTRGHISILQRPELERLACECYRVVRNEFARLLDV